MAATITVNSTGDMSGEGQCTLRDAITAANGNTATAGCTAGDDNNDTIMFGESVAGSTITLGGTALPTIMSGSTLVIDAMASEDDDSTAGVTIDANEQSRIFINQGELTLNDLTLINGVADTADDDDTNGDARFDRSGGAILNLGGTLIVSGGAMNNNTADRAGGAIEVATGGTVEGDDSAIDNLRVTLDNVNFSGNNAGVNPGNGGALHVSGAGDIQVNGGTFSNNISEEGGALWNNQGTMTVSDATFTANVANGAAPASTPAEGGLGGGAIFGQVDGANGTIVITGSMFTGNMAGNEEDGEGDSSASGGAILAGDGTTLDVTNSVFRDNSARRAGGAIEVLPGSTTTLDNVTGTGNDAGQNPGNGGFLHVTGDGNVAVTGGSYARNTAVEGGAFWNNQGEMTLTGVSIVNNEATGAEATQGGGGIYAEGNAEGDSGTLTISDSRIAMNKASGTSGSGGGILVSPNATANITNTRIEANQANRAGGGIENAGGTVTLDGVTLGGESDAQGNVIAPNPNPGNGGGLHIGGAGSTTITNTAVGYNQAVEGGGLWNSAGGALSVTNTTVSDNSADTGAGVYQDGGDGGSVTGEGISLSYASVVNNNGVGVDAGNDAAPEDAYTITNSLIAANDTNLGEGIDASDEDGNVVGDASLLDGMYRLYGGPTATQPLAMDSDAVDTNGACSSTDTDQRGADRDFDVPDVDNGGTCDSGAYELTDDPVVQVAMLDLGDVVLGEDDTEAAVLGFTLTNNGEESVTVGGISGYVDRDDMLPAGVDLTEFDLTVYADSNDNGSYDSGSDMSVGSGSLDDNGSTFTIDFNGGAGESIGAGDSVSYFLVASPSGDSQAPATVGVTALDGDALKAVYAGGALLALLSLVSVGGMRRRTQLLLIVAALALTLTACSDSDSDDDRNVNIGQPDNDAMGQGQVSFTLRQLNVVAGGTGIVIGDGLPVSGPVVSFEMPSDDDSMSDDG
ncbi:hypothetical protein J7355_12615 [Endozoicomonas sp. G2_2]|uniref:beta strand repeat-containing protein n=1 Tax=Endozoicomonas sp. G2_2 TaxID=2821092 RepID=UPI001ADD0907|nr:CSLREA domain-containing protein [Endozoicomonas sp. G2_2]MBO9470943.1 hypothetical protein [Endozoicomonas sp. G2_2]